MSVIVKGGGGSTAKELVNSTGAKLADLEKKGSGKVSVVGGLGNTPPEKVLQGSIYSDESGVRRTGTMEDITPELNTQSDLIKEIRAMLVGRVTEANATPEDILKGKKAYVGEKLVTGVLEKGIELLGGYPKMSTGSFTVTNSANNFTLNHELGETPKLIIVYASAEDLDKSMTANAYYFMIGTPQKWGGLFKPNGGSYLSCSATGAKSNETENSLNIKTTGLGSSGQSLTIYWKSGVTYNWIAFA